MNDANETTAATPFPTYVQTDEDRARERSYQRRDCLDFAVRVHQGNSYDHNHILSTARAFYNFVQKDS